MMVSLEKAGRMLLDADTIVITAHVHPDGDAIGSSLGLCYALQALGKKVEVWIDDELPAMFSLLPGYSQIKQPENKVKADLLVILDTAADRIGRVAELVQSDKVLNLDHHISNKAADEFLYVDPKRAATAEIVCQLFKEMHWSFSEEAAINLYAGIATDCGFFRYSNTSPLTMRLAAELLEAGVRPNVISEAFEQKSYALVQALGNAMRNIELFGDGKIAGLFLDLEQVSNIESTEGFIDLVRVIEGVDVAILLKCIEKDTCRVSMRSKHTDVSRIASGFGGGGHVRAAGCTLYMSYNDAKQAILTAVTAQVEAER